MVKGELKDPTESAKSEMADAVTLLQDGRTYIDGERVGGSNEIGDTRDDGCSKIFPERVHEIRSE